MSQAIHADGKYWIAPFAPGFDARLVGGHEVVPRNNGADPAHRVHHRAQAPHPTCSA